MLDQIFDGMTMPWQQVLLLIGGFLCLSLGVLFAGNEIYWRRKALRVAGIIAGVRQKGNVFYPVYRYQLPDGSAVETTADIGSAGTMGKETGRMVPLLVFADAPPSARAAGNWAFGIMGGLLVAAGVYLVYAAFALYPVTKLTKYLAAALVCYSGMKLQGVLFAKGGRVSLASWKAAMKQRHETEMQGLPVLRVGDASPGALSSQTASPARQAKMLRIWGPVLAAIGALLLWLGVQSGTQLANTLQYGLTAPGQITQSRSEDDGAVSVSFTDATGRKIDFRDSGGRNTDFHAGDSVTVLYLPHDPAGSAMIDRGVANYIASLSMLSFGTVFCLAGLVFYRKGRPPKEGGG